MNDILTAYPLTWPEGWKRTSPYDRTLSRYSDKPFGRVRDEIVRQVGLLGGSELILSTNIPLKRDGLPYARYTLADPGIAVYFKRDGKALCMACDQYCTIAENGWAIVLTIEALRQIIRAGASDLIERAFTGFLALPAPHEPDWWDVLGVSQRADWEIVRDAYRNLARQHHPDTGDGNIDQFDRVQRAYAAAKEAQLPTPAKQKEMDRFAAAVEDWRVNG